MFSLPYQTTIKEKRGKIYKNKKKTCRRRSTAFKTVQHSQESANCNKSQSIGYNWTIIGQALGKCNRQRA